MDLSFAAVKRLMKSAAPESNVSEEAVIEMIARAESFIFETSKKSYGFAEHAKRKTIRKEDVEMALNL